MPETKDHPQVDVPERPDLAERIQSQFDKVFADVNESDLDDAIETVDEKSVTDDANGEEHAASDAAETDETQAPVDEEKETPKVEEAAAAPAPKPAEKAPTLPEAYRRSLKAYEWTDEEINEAARQPGFLTTAAKLHQTRSKEIAAWAEMGRQQKKTTDTPSKDAVQQSGQQADNGPVQLKPVDAAKLKKQYGEEALIDEIVGPVNQTIAEINRILPLVQQTQARSQQAQIESLTRQVDGFFSGKDMATYKEQYGADSGSLNDGQLQARQKVLEMADALIVGARQQHRMLSFDEAMQMAHDSVSIGTVKQAARNEITTQLKARNKAISMKPSARGTVKASPAQSRTELEKNVKGKLAALFTS